KVALLATAPERSLMRRSYALTILRERWKRVSLQSGADFPVDRDGEKVAKSGCDQPQQAAPTDGEIAASALAALHRERHWQSPASSATASYRSWSFTQSVKLFFSFRPFGIMSSSA